MKNMSFSLTTRQFRARTKTVTRRVGWSKLRSGERVMAVVKGMGLKQGEHIERLGVIEIVSNRKERLDEMPDSDCALEGFPELTAKEFAAMFCKHMRVKPDFSPNRIEFKYVD